MEHVDETGFSGVAERDVDTTGNSEGRRNGMRRVRFVARKGKISYCVSYRFHRTDMRLAFHSCPTL